MQKALDNVYLSEHIPGGYNCAGMWWSLMMLSNWIYMGGLFSLRYTSNSKNSWPVHPPFNSLVEQLALLVYLNLRLMSFIQ